MSYAGPVSNHSARVEYARTRRGGGIGTGGKAVVMLRFDHWLVNFRDVILPILREFNLPATLNMNYDNMDNVQNGSGTIPWDMVQDWNQYDAIEIANHGSTHTNPTTHTGIFHEVVEGRRNLEAAMPRVAVETWQEHGSAYLIATDIPGDIGLNLGRRPKNFFESYAGKLVLAEHAVVEGKCGGFYVNLNGEPQLGQSHMSIDRSTATQAIAQVETAKAFGRGVTLYLHPGYMDVVLVGGVIWDVAYDGAGAVTVTDPAATNTNFATRADFLEWADTNGHNVKMAVDHFRELCQHLATERDAGAIMVMTAAGGAFADKRTDYRENLLVNPEFTGDHSDWWTGSTRWTVTNPGPGVIIKAGATPYGLSQRMLLHSRFGWAMGAAHELLVTARAGVETTLTLRVEKLADPVTWQTERTFTIPCDSVERDYRLNISLPADPTITQMSVKISGANLDIVGPPVLAAI